MIEAFDLRKRFGAVEVLRGLDLSIARGRVTAIVGPNGAGKTTFIKSVLGLARPDSGTLTFDGVAIGDDDAYRARIGYMPQLARVPEHRAGEEPLHLRRGPRGTTKVAGQLAAAAGTPGEPAARRRAAVHRVADAASGGRRAAPAARRSRTAASRPSAAASGAVARTQ